MARLGEILYAGALLTLPWVGLDLVALLSGRDLGAGFQTSYLLLAGACLCWLVAAGGWIGSFWAAIAPRWRRLLVGTCAAVLVSALGLVVASPGTAAPPRLWRFGKQAVQLGIMLGFLIAPYLRTREAAGWERARRLIGAAVLSQLAYAALQAVDFARPLGWFAALDHAFTSNPAILSGSRELYLGRGFTGLPRLRGTMCEPLYLGSFLVGALPLLWEGARLEGSRLQTARLQGARRRGWMLLFAGALVLLLWTWSRGAWLGAIAGAAVGAILLRRAELVAPRRRSLLVVVGVGAAVIAALMIARPEVALLPARRLLQSFSREDWSNLTRLYSMQAAWRAFLASPLVGVGWGQFAFHFPLLVDPLGLQSQFAWPVVNSFPLEILCETGVLGFGIFAAGVVLLARAVWSATGATTPAGVRLGPEGRRRVAVAAAATVGVWSQLLTFSQYNLPHLWVTTGLLLAALAPVEARAEAVAGADAGAAAGGTTPPVAAAAAAAGLERGGESTASGAGRKGAIVA